MSGQRYPRSLLGLGLSLALGLACQAAAAGLGAADSQTVKWSETGPLAPSISADWRLSPSPAMRLGLPADRWVAEEPPASGPTGVERCRKWRAVADSLGETFAAHTLRKTLVRRHCELFDPDDGAAMRWDWPWSGLERGSVVPPRPHRTFGAWTIRCGTGPARRRCALVHQAAGSASLDAPVRIGLPAGFTTHFVIDRVAGREVLLWRLFVPRANIDPAAVAGLGGGMASADPGPVPSPGTGEVRFKLGPARPWERFPMCVATGCLMEVSAERAGAVATRLAEGKPLELVLRRVGSAAVHVSLPARGFAPALAELMRLRRIERRPDGGR